MSILHSQLTLNVLSLNFLFLNLVFIFVCSIIVICHTTRVITTPSYPLVTPIYNFFFRNTSYSISLSNIACNKGREYAMKATQYFHLASFTPTPRFLNSCLQVNTSRITLLLGAYSYIYF